MRVAYKKSNRYVITYNTRLYSVCARKLHAKWMCYNAQFVSDMCREFPITLAKTVRFRVEQAAALIKEIPELKVEMHSFQRPI